MVSSVKTLWKMPPPCHCLVLALSLGRAHSNSPAAEVSADLHWRGKSKLRRKGQPIPISCVQKNPTTPFIATAATYLNRVFLWVLHVKTGRISTSRCTAWTVAVLSIKLFQNAAESELNIPVTSLASHLQAATNRDGFWRGSFFGGERRDTGLACSSHLS